MEPLCGVSFPARISSMEDFPTPLGPTMARISHGFALQFTSFKALRHAGFQLLDMVGETWTMAFVAVVVFGRRLLCGFFLEDLKRVLSLLPDLVVDAIKGVERIREDDESTVTDMLCQMGLSWPNGHCLLVTVIYT
ncbi:hypothetical protein V6N11_044269 [Hibiscus sabdariffa]|uniref:Uncharacterized protein n=1 Tax=Hibiscus sabdariffa TaxID=183260 RepID=A0ABR2REQ7_9ROSI